MSEGRAYPGHPPAIIEMERAIREHFGLTDFSTQILLTTLSNLKQEKKIEKYDLLQYRKNRDKYRARILTKDSEYTDCGKTSREAFTTVLYTYIQVVQEEKPVPTLMKQSCDLGVITLVDAEQSASTNYFGIPWKKRFVDEIDTGGSVKREIECHYCNTKSEKGWCRLGHRCSALNKCPRKNITGSRNMLGRKRELYKEKRIWMGNKPGAMGNNV